MAKPSNIIEKDRSLWKVLVFSLKESFRASPGYSTARYILSAINASILFVQFGGLGIVINEFTRAGIQNARQPVIIEGFVLIILGTFIPGVIASLQNFFSSMQNSDLQRHLQNFLFTTTNRLDIGTIENSDFQNMFEVAGSRGWASIYNTISSISNSIGNAAALVIASVSLAIISPIILLILFIALIPIYLIEKRIAERDANLWKMSAEKRRSWLAKVTPIYDKNSLIELKNFNLVHVFSEKWKTLIGSFHSDSKEIEKSSLVYMILSDFVVIFGYGIAFFLVVSKVYTGALLIGSLVFAFTAISRFQTALQALFENFGRLNEQKKYINTFMDFLEVQPMITSGSKKFDSKEDVVIEFKNVSFAYPGTDRVILHNLSLKISQGDNIAIVGLNGAGKTTLIKLLTRVYDPTEGEILVNGFPLSDYDLGSWKSKLGILLQEYSIYAEETIEENITLGNTTKKNKALAKKSAQETTIADTIAMLPQKYQQKIGTEFSGGVEFSKGQKQKLALARTLYRQAPIMILDEPTASIDAVSEDTIFKNLKTAHFGQTRIIISHKFSNVRDADKIILIKDGTIFEEGSHEELMSLGGTYKELFELQAEGYR